MDVKREVFNFLRSKGDIPGQTDEEQLAYNYLDKGLIDSMGIIEMVTTFEEKFNIHFDSAHMQLEEFLTVGGLIQLIEQMIKEQYRA